jgi:hypothetical protein
MNSILRIDRLFSRANYATFKRERVLRVRERGGCQMFPVQMTFLHIYSVEKLLDCKQLRAMD